MDPLSVLIVTYERTEVAVRTIQALKHKLDIDPALLFFHIADDGSSGSHIKTLLDEIHTFCPNKVGLTISHRAGVGVNMNMGQQACFAITDNILWLEDDWELTQHIDPQLFIDTLKNPEIGMIRLGYLSPGITGELVSYSNRLWWKLDKGPTYTFTGHASFRNKRFFEAYGKYQHGLTPGETELYMCGVFNNTPGPDILIPAWTGEWGLFAHIGTNSLKDVKPL